MIYVFAGPSITRDCINNILPDAIVLPPIRAADILSLLLSDSLPRPTCILIIDGLFYSTLSVRHKEIIYAMKQGIPVFGTSSMGALRAAELDDYGMVGIGKVYDYFSSNHITSDDEVAIVHSGSYPYISHTIALINIRLTLVDLVAAEKLMQEDAQQILTEASLIHFTNRHAAAIDSNKIVQSLYPGFITDIVDWKMKDALHAVSILPSLLTNRVLPVSSILEDISLGTHSINFFMDSESARFSRSADSEILYKPSFPQRDASLLDLFTSLNLMAAIQFSRTLNIKPSDKLYNICHQIVTSLGPYVDGIPLNDCAEIHRLSLCLATLLTLYSCLTNHSGLLGNHKVLSENVTFSSIFQDFYKVEQSLLKNLFLCVNETNTDFADFLSKCLKTTDET